MSDDATVVFDLLDDEYARDILAETYEEPMSAEALADACDASPSTIYRRIERLRDQRLLADDQRLDPDGNHYKVYTANLQRVTVELTADGFELDVDREEDPADRFTRLYEGFKR
ncbi:helix-turn-helix domain-containing protein [Halorussus salilacus]|uniref:ArsR/SmtB family transcription factor n=1 Tax=Halorussus salilacus TaxID=2953750 RepID=UPI00209F1367|nr:winged helix-turn-helix domain-containing protein [Halorussus salilacus]USZ67660.1 helix-turn-helix domain-containing protein [Halorussus salilacus]